MFDNQVRMLLCGLLLVCVSTMTVACPSECTCVGGRVDCRSRGLISAALIYPNTTEELDLSDNLITEISSTTLKNLPQLKKLIIDSCDISRIDQGAFTNALRKLEYISISNNKRHITLPRSPLFEGLPVKSIAFRNSRISNVNFLENTYPLSLDLSGSGIKFSDLLFFQSALNSLEWVSLQKLNIDELSVEDLSAFENVKHFDFSHNNLYELQGVIFKHSKNLETLIVAHNEIAHLEDFGFNIASVKHLDLQHNDLEQLELKIIDGMNRLQILNLENNKFQIAPQEMETMFTSIFNVKLGGNPFHCNCELVWFRQWLSRRNLTTGITCASPSNMIGNIFTHEESEFVCKDPVIEGISRMKVIEEGENLYLSCSAAGDPPPKMTWENPLGYKQTSGSGRRNKERVYAYLTVQDIKRGASGKYKCSARNLKGTVSEETQVIVVEKETSTKQPTAAGPKIAPHVIIIIVVFCVILVVFIVVVTAVIYFRRKETSDTYAVSDMNRSVNTLYKSSDTLAAGGVNSAHVQDV